MSRDGYFYVYFIVNGGVSVARARVSDVVQNALSGNGTAFTKYSNGSFSQPGLGGNASTIMTGTCQWMDVAYDSHIDKYVMVLVASNDLWITCSDDGVGNWSSRQLVESDPGESFYPTIVGIGQDPKIIDSSQFNVYYTYSLQGAWNRWSDAVLLRRLIAVGQ